MWMSIAVIVCGFGNSKDDPQDRAYECRKTQINNRGKRRQAPRRDWFKNWPPEHGPCHEEGKMLKNMHNFVFQREVVQGRQMPDPKRSIGDNQRKRRVT